MGRKRARATDDTVAIAAATRTALGDEAEEAETSPQVLVEFVSEDGEESLQQMAIPVESTVTQLEGILNTLKEGEKMPYAFWIDGAEITERLDRNLMAVQRQEWIDEMQKKGKRFKKEDPYKLDLEVPTEKVLRIVYRPQSLFKVRPVTRCLASLTGHKQAVLVVAFSPDGTKLVSGSGDMAIRVWDLHTSTCMKMMVEHNSWVQVISWSPTGEFFVSGSKDGKMIVWHGEELKRLGSPITAHTKWITSISWEPFHKNLKCNRFVSSSKDKSLRMWKASIAGGTRDVHHALSGHEDGVTCCKWGGSGYIYSASQDRSIIVWDAEDGKPLKRMVQHAHWVTFLALNTDYCLRTGHYDHSEKKFETREEKQAYALERYTAVVTACGGEKLVSSSDDNTLQLWDPVRSDQPIHRLTGHQQVVMHTSFSPDGLTIASASFDKSVKLWRGTDGVFTKTLRAHVGGVMYACWSADSRLLLSASRDSTLKVWDVAKGKRVFELPGHSDEVFTADWSPDGLSVASGSKDKTIRIWRH